MTSPEEITRCLVLRPLKDSSLEQSHKFQNFTNQSTGRHNIRSRISSRNWRTLREKRPVSGCLVFQYLALSKAERSLQQAADFETQRHYKQNKGKIMECLLVSVIFKWCNLTWNHVHLQSSITDVYSRQSFHSGNCNTEPSNLLT